MRHKTLRLPDELSDEITRRARIKGVPDADYTRLLIERGLLLEGAEMAMQTPIPPAYWGVCEAVLETRNILRSLAAAREHGTIPKAQVQAKDEIERMKNHGADWANPAGLVGCDPRLRDPRQLGQAGEQRRTSLVHDRDRARCFGGRILVPRGHYNSRSKAVGAPRPEQPWDGWADRRSPQSG